MNCKKAASSRFFVACQFSGSARPNRQRLLFDNSPSSLVISSSSVISTGFAGFLGGPASKVTSSSLSSASSRLLTRAGCCGGKGWLKVVDMLVGASVGVAGAKARRGRTLVAIRAFHASAVGRRSVGWGVAQAVPGVLAGVRAVRAVQAAAPAAARRLDRQRRQLHRRLRGALPRRGRRRGGGRRRGESGRRGRFVGVLAAERRLGSAGLAEPDFALHHDIGRPADQKQVLDIVAAHQDKPAMAVDCRGVHHGKPCLAVAATCDEGAEGKAADQPDDHQHDHEQDQSGESPDDRCSEFRTAQSFEPIGHKLPR